MKKQSTIILLLALLLNGCASGRMGNPGTIMAGAAIGGSLGSSIGGLVGDNHHGWRGGYRGSAIGNIVGTVAGAAIGNAITAPRDTPIEDEAYMPETTEIHVKRSKAKPQRVKFPSPKLRIRNIRFIDSNRNHIIDAGESSKIIFEVMNEGKHSAYNLVPIVETTTKVKHIGISPSIMVEEILPNEGIRYTATIYAGTKLRKKEITFRVAVENEHGNITDAHEFVLPSQN